MELFFFFFFLVLYLFVLKFLIVETVESGSLGILDGFEWPWYLILLSCDA